MISAEWNCLSDDGGQTQCDSPSRIVAWLTRIRSTTVSRGTLLINGAADNDCLEAIGATVFSQP